MYGSASTDVYPMPIVVYAIVRPDIDEAQGELVKQFLDFVLSDDGQTMIEDFGYVPLPDDTLTASREALAIVPVPTTTTTTTTTTTSTTTTTPSPTTTTTPPTSTTQAAVATTTTAAPTSTAAATTTTPRTTTTQRTTTTRRATTTQRSTTTQRATTTAATTTSTSSTDATTTSIAAAPAVAPIDPSPPTSEFATNQPGSGRLAPPTPTIELELARSSELSEGGPRLIGFGASDLRLLALIAFWLALLSAVFLSAQLRTRLMTIWRGLATSLAPGGRP